MVKQDLIKVAGQYLYLQMEILLLLELLHGHILEQVLFVYLALQHLQPAHNL